MGGGNLGRGGGPDREGERRRTACMHDKMMLLEEVYMQRIGEKCALS